jgi:hypothetical protein
MAVITWRRIEWNIKANINKVMARVKQKKGKMGVKKWVQGAYESWVLG